ncbi:MAG: ABC transporter permease [Candidatus Marinimicrobia bacterium]|nr:ABC transporter permease [Candidatus Neomarinimicrobiota bacterium]
MKRIVDFIRSDKSLYIGSILIGIIIIFSLIGPFLSPYNYSSQNLSEALQSPSISHPLGTDYYGRDVLTRMMHGGQITLGIALLATTIAVLISMIIGLISAFIGGWLDRILMRLVDIMLGFPKLFIILLVIGMGYSSIGLIILFLAIFSWMEIARIVRSEVLVIKEQLYIKSAEAIGLRRRRIIFIHILPNVMGTIIVSSVLLISTLILIESSISFLGLGVQPPNASWGTILTEGRIDPIGTWWISVFSGIFIIAAIIGFNLIGDGLRNILDPKFDRNS